MRQVRTCDFCGDDASGVYEPLPSSIPDSPRMLLCDACRDRLSSVVDPLLARIGGDLEEDTGGRSIRDSGNQGSTTDYRDLDDDRRDGASDGADPDGADPDDLEGREWPADPGERVDEGPAATAEATGEGETASDGTPEGAGGESDPAGAATRAPDEPTFDEVDEPSGTSAAPPSSVDDLADDGGVEVSESRDASGRTQRERGGAPRGYRKVLRFLENRELPVDRAEAEQLAAEAYELDVGEVGAAIDHAVQYGRLREVSGELRR